MINHGVMDTTLMGKREGLLGILVGLYCPVALAMQESERYSFFSAIHVERIDYKESASLFPVNTHSTVLNPTIKNGGMHKLSARSSLLIETISSLYPARVQEKWLFNNSDEVFQQNSLTYTLSSKRLYYYQQWRPRLSWVAGLQYSLHNFKRFDPESKLGVLAWELVEETKAELLLQSGLSLQYGRFYNSQWRFYLQVMYGLPIYSRAENTEYTNLKFKTVTGYSWHAQVGVSRKVYKRLHVAILGEWNYLYRQAMVETFSEQLDAQAVLTTKVELPENTTTVSRLGMTVYWVL